jgi:Flp pilus assembly protein TadB
VVNVTTGGVGAPVVSAVEDGTSLVASLLAILAPLLLVVLVVVGFFVVRAWWRRRREARRLERGAPA